MDADSLVERVARILEDASDATAVEKARAIVAALRVPTKRMTKAGSDIPVGCCMTNASDAGEVWEYMIDAALADAREIAAS